MLMSIWIDGGSEHQLGAVVRCDTEFIGGCAA